jgi:hypothetical protein
MMDEASSSRGGDNMCIGFYKTSVGGNCLGDTKTKGKFILKEQVCKDVGWIVAQDRLD